MVLSHFQEDTENTRQHVNYLVFQGSQQRFYIEQHMHSIDCVFFPDQQLMVRFPHSGQFTRTKLKKFIKSVLIPEQGVTTTNLTPAQPKFAGLLMNSLSPHHFFYDFLPALEEASKLNALDCIPHIWGLEGMCYFPLDALYNISIPNTMIDWRALREKNKSQDSYFITAGVSHKMIPLHDTKVMDKKIVAAAKSYTHRKDVLDIEKLLRAHSPLFLVGISAYGRSWLNQESFLHRFLTHLKKIYPNCAIIFDGVTSHTYKYQFSEPLFKTDSAIVEKISRNIPKDLTWTSLVGFTSIEKLFIAQNIDFSFTNISTGTIYTSRFFDIPGVGHICRALLYLEKLVGRFNTSVQAVPDEFIHDAKPFSELLNHSELDYMDYTMNEDKLEEFLLEKIRHTLAKKHSPTTQPSVD